MANVTSNTEQKKSTSFPPRRGQVKAQIFESLAKKVVSAVSKVGEALGMNRGNDGNGGASASSTPPPSSYNSDVNSDIS
ncbi:hypothetical protein I3843_13G090100 [Carya illinoinensis]|uniref:Uncharacterized protein n=1 Tax=Carya illinoinensis TaxID=32201 RepID=A0A8T1NS01_CARIL|nr:hypothetical protein I3760_13G102600 [Carya illinoinensis]KAG6631637.1 hypothetical protein CIPAW_13G104400 [Carya illinoinensis]KAG6681644.1 hypothetical protein I3842_13G103300 [Carya illinoinensis]KAG7949957.1 hypothetical protein I3843_13G090100 [Carya illinoinensis]